MSVADQRAIKLISFEHICGEVIWPLLEYCISCTSALSLHRQATNSLTIVQEIENIGNIKRCRDGIPKSMQAI